MHASRPVYCSSRIPPANNNTRSTHTRVKKFITQSSLTTDPRNETLISIPTVNRSHSDARRALASRRIGLLIFCLELRGCAKRGDERVSAGVNELHALRQNNNNNNNGEKKGRARGERCGDEETRRRRTRVATRSGEIKWKNLITESPGLRMLRLPPGEEGSPLKTEMKFQDDRGTSSSSLCSHLSPRKAVGAGPGTASRGLGKTKRRGHGALNGSRCKVEISRRLNGSGTRPPATNYSRTNGGAPIDGHIAAARIVARENLSGLFNLSGLNPGNGILCATAITGQHLLNAISAGRGRINCTPRRPFRALITRRGASWEGVLYMEIK